MRFALLSLCLASSSFAELPKEPVKSMESLLSSSSWPKHLSPKVALAYRLARTHAERGDEAPPHWVLGRSVTVDGLTVHLRFERPIVAGDLEQVRARGCTLQQLPSGDAVVVGRVAAAHCRWDGLVSLGAVPGLLTVTPTLGLVAPRPVAAPPTRTFDEVELPALQRSRYPSSATGAGVTVADIDAAADVFHPFLFRADGGRFAWLDVNGDGQFTPGVDAVDADKDGVADANEVLRMRKAGVYAVVYQPQPGWKTFNDDPGFVAGVDWLYQDVNNNNARDFGPSFGDSAPGFGEPVYIVDDVDGDGVLDVGERLMKLGTSKVKAVLDFQQQSPREYVRGTSLTAFSATPDEQLHGSMVLGTIAGGDARLKYHGIAPDAELLLAYRMGGDSLLASLAWSQQKQAQIALWEMATWYWEYLDGSADLEAACDDAHDQGMTQIGAAGNLGGSRKHTVLTITTPTTLVLRVPSDYSRAVGVNFNFSASTPVNVTLTMGPQTVSLSGSQGQSQLGSYGMQWFSDTSLRNTRMVGAYMETANQQPLANDATITVTLTPTGGPAKVHAYTFDYDSSWGLGAQWTTGYTDANTYGTPAVGDKTLAIGTYLIDFPIPPRVSGELADHSSRGPRADNGDDIDVVAPEDHITSFTQTGLPWGQLWVGGGTSNASPVTVGVAALLKSLQPSLTPTQMGTKLRQARTEAQMGTVPNQNWGFGKVSAYRANSGMAPVMAPAAPVARGSATVASAGQLRLDASASTDPGGLALSYRWDADDDGVMDGAPSANAVQTVASTQEWVTLEVANTAGAVGRVRVKVSGASGDGGMGGGAGGAGGAGGGEAGGAGGAGGGEAGGAGGGEAGGAGGGAVAGGSGGEGGVTTMLPPPLPVPQPKPGCGCTAAPTELLALAALTLIRRRTRRAD